MATQSSAPKQQAVSPLDDLYRLEEFRTSTPSRERVYGSVEAVKWTVRKYREKLFECGAVVEIGGKLWIVGEPFDRAVIELSGSPRKTSRSAA